MATSESKNLERIVQSINQHDERCTFPVIEIAMNAFEIDRLGWSEIKGIPVVADDKIGTGRFELRCERPTGSGAPSATVKEAVSA